MPEPSLRATSLWPAWASRWWLEAVVLLVQMLAVLAVAHFAAVASSDRDAETWLWRSGPLPEEWELPTEGAAVIAVALLAMTVAPVYPAVGLYVYLGLLYLHDDGRAEQVFVRQSGILECVTALTALGCVGWMIRRRRRPAWFASRLTWLVTALVGWLGVGTMVSAFTGSAAHPAIEYRFFQFVVAWVLFLVAAQTLRKPREFWWLGVVLGAVLSVHGLRARGFGEMGQNIAAFSVMALPMVVLAARLSRNRIVQLALALAAVNLLWLLAQTRNRGAALALMVALLLSWLQSDRKWLRLALVAPLLLVGCSWFASTGYGKRFVNLVRGGPNWDRATAEKRLELWQAGMRIAWDHPVLGVGLENYGAVAGQYGPKLAGKNPHTNFVTMACEAGFPGLVLYAALFFGAIGAAWRLGRVSTGLWPGGAARSVVAALGAYLTAGFFLGLHSHGAAYLLAGGVVGLGSTLSGRELTGST